MGGYRGPSLHPHPNGHAIETPAGLGPDVGGAATPWSLADGAGLVLAGDQAGGLAARRLGQKAGRAELRAMLAGLAHTLRGAGWAGAAPDAAGFHGYSEDAAIRQQLETLVALALDLANRHPQVLGRMRLPQPVLLHPPEHFQTLHFPLTHQRVLCLHHRPPTPLKGTLVLGAKGTLLLWGHRSTCCPGAAYTGG